MIQIKMRHCEIYEMKMMKMRISSSPLAFPKQMVHHDPLFNLQFQEYSHDEAVYLVQFSPDECCNTNNTISNKYNRKKTSLRSLEKTNQEKYNVKEYRYSSVRT